jgi:hypothetical protein
MFHSGFHQPRALPTPGGPERHCYWQEPRLRDGWLLVRSWLGKLFIPNTVKIGLYLTHAQQDPVTGLGTPSYPKMLDLFLNLP